VLALGGGCSVSSLGSEASVCLGRSGKGVEGAGGLGRVAGRDPLPVRGSAAGWAWRRRLASGAGAYCVPPPWHSVGCSPDRAN